MAKWAVQKTYEGTTESGEVVRQRVTGPTDDKFELVSALVHSMHMLADEVDGNTSYYVRLISVELVRLNEDGTRYESTKVLCDRDFDAV